MLVHVVSMVKNKEYVRQTCLIRPEATKESCKFHTMFLQLKSCNQFQIYHLLVSPKTLFQSQSIPPFFTFFVFYSRFDFVQFFRSVFLRNENRSAFVMEEKPTNERTTPVTEKEVEYGSPDFLRSRNFF